ncbi:MAG: 1,4-alpha-glucan branching protein [Nocardioides sp.]
MAILHDATITPGKRDLMAGWLPSRSWFDGDLDRKPVGSFRFDDPDGEVGIEFFLLGGTDGPALLVPMTYRAAPLDGAEEHLVGTTDHSVLGPRWVYDALADPVGVSALLSAILAGGHEAALEMEQDGEIVTFDPTCGVVGSGSAAGPVTVSSVDVLDSGDPSVVRAGGFEIAVARLLGPGVSGEETLTATWGGGDPVVVAATRRTG